MRPSRAKSLPGGYPTGLRGAPSVACPNCGALVGKPCLRFRVQAGERLYSVGARVNPHPERVAAART